MSQTLTPEQLWARYEWRYLPGRGVRHAIRPAGALVGQFEPAACGISPDWGVVWRGTGLQIEYETCRALRPCVRCIQQLGLCGPCRRSNCPSCRRRERIEQLQKRRAYRKGELL